MVASELSISRGEQRPGPRGNARLLSLVTRVLHQGVTSSPGRFSKAWEKRPGDEVDQGFKQQRRRRLQKRHLKSDGTLLQTLLFHLVQFVKCWQIFQELNPKGLYRSLGEEKRNRCPVCLHSPQNMKEVSRRSRATTAKKCTKKRNARVKLLFCFSNPIAFLPFSLPSPRCRLSTLLYHTNLELATILTARLISLY